MAVVELTGLTKADPDRRLVGGWLVVSRVDGQPYVDLQGDWVSEDAILDAAVDYMRDGGALKLQHAGEQIGQMVAIWPVLPMLCGPLGVTARMSGLIGLARVAEGDAGDRILAAVGEGKLTGFSIGGSAPMVDIAGAAADTEPMVEGAGEGAGRPGPMQAV